MGSQNDDISTISDQHSDCVLCSVCFKGLQASTGHILNASDFDTLYKEEQILLNAKWADIEKNRHNEYQTVAKRIKGLLLKYQPNIVYIMRSSIARLNNCKTALEARKIVTQAMEKWTNNLDNLVIGIRNRLLLISEVFLTYFKLMLARCRIYSPTSAAKFQDMFEKIIAEEMLLNIKGEGHDKPGVQTINDAVRYFSGVFNPAREFLEQLKVLDRGTAFNEDNFKEYLADAHDQIATIGNILVEIVDSMEYTAYKGTLKIDE